MSARAFAEKLLKAEPHYRAVEVWEGDAPMLTLRAMEHFHLSRLASIIGVGSKTSTAISGQGVVRAKSSQLLTG